MPKEVFKSSKISGIRVKSIQVESSQVESSQVESTQTKKKSNKQVTKNDNFKNSFVHSVVFGEDEKWCKGSETEVLGESTVVGTS